MAPPKSKYIEYQKNPQLFLSEVLDNHQRWGKQIEIINSVRDNRNTYVKSCHGVGKTFTAKDVSMWFLYCFKPSIVITTAPSWPQVEKLLWAEINSAHKNAKVNLGGICLKTSLTLDDKWFALGISPKLDSDDDAKRMTGFHQKHVLVVFDEAPACDEKLWMIKETLMTSENVRFLAIGNPVMGHGSFFEGFRSDTVNKIEMSIFDSPNFKDNKLNLDKLVDISQMDIEARENTFNKMKIPSGWLSTPRWAVERLLAWGLDSPLFQSRVLGQFPEKTTDTVISLANLEKCVGIDLKRKGHKVLGIDIARFGDDNTCLKGFNNYVQDYSDKFNGQDLVKTANLIIHKIRVENYTIIVLDDTSLGGGVTDMVNKFLETFPDSHKVRVIPVNFAQSATRDEYEGIVTEMYFTANDFLKEMEIQIKDEGSLFNELSSRKYEYTNKGKFKIEPKDKFKKRTNGKSPDEADAFVLACWGMYMANRVGGEFDSEEGREEYDW